jgi:hypothetical protein
MRNLKVLKGVIYADVDLGVNELGARVSVQVKVPTLRPEVQDAIRPLSQLMDQIAHDNVRSALNQEGRS